MAQRLLDALHGGSGADERNFICFDGECGFTQTPVFEYQVPLFGGMGNGRDQPVGRIGFRKKIIGAVPHALHGRGDVAVARDEDDGDIGIDLAQALEELQPVHVRHADVGHDHAVKVPVQDGQRRARAGVRFH
ncbi:hypothetical protein D3C71_1208680 [compost metagenome]